jgi:hypothetical protein
LFCSSDRAIDVVESHCSRQTCIGYDFKSYCFRVPHHTMGHAIGKMDVVESHCSRQTCIGYDFNSYCFWVPHHTMGHAIGKMHHSSELFIGSSLPHWMLMPHRTDVFIIPHRPDVFSMQSSDCCLRASKMHIFFKLICIGSSLLHWMLIPHRPDVFPMQSLPYCHVA